MTVLWMEDLFANILSQSILASWLILAVILVRICMKKAPKCLRYVLWALVAVRLLCPISIESPWSLVPEIEISKKDSTLDKYLDSIAVKEVENKDAFVQQELLEQKQIILESLLEEESNLSLIQIEQYKKAQEEAKNFFDVWPKTKPYMYARNAETTLPNGWVSVQHVALGIPM